MREDGGRFPATIPVLGPRDEAMARRVLAIGRQTMESWLAANLDGIRSDLAELSFTRSCPSRRGSP